MFDYLSTHDGPVVVGLEAFETVYAKDQPEYLPLRTLPAESGMSAISRWHLNDEQRKAIAEGADILLEVTHFRGPLAPVRMMVTDRCDVDTLTCKRWFAAQTNAPYAPTLEELAAES
jgi:hypothetical protein